MNSDLLRRLNHKRRSLLATRAPSESCKTGGLYKAPAPGQSVNSLDILTIEWDPSCLTDVSKVDIYLNAQKTTSPRLHKYQDVDFAAGSFLADIKPKWWNATDSVDLSLTIVPAGQPDFMNDLPAGPTFTATYAAPDDGTVPESADPSISDNDNGTTVVGAIEDTTGNSGLSPGKTAAAVLVPLLFIIGLGIFAYLKVMRQRRQDKSVNFSTTVDKRMSTISTDWKSMTASGANAAVRASMHQGDRSSMYQQDNTGRFSTFSYSNTHNSSTHAVEGGHPGTSPNGIYQNENPSIGDFDYVNGYHPSPTPRSTPNNVMRPSFTQSRVSFADSTAPTHLRPSRISFAEGTRQSRVSFADGTRPSVDSRRSVYSQNTTGDRASRAYRFDVAADAPPVPHRQFSNDSSPIGLMSPEQSNGPFQLSPQEINTKASGITNEDEDVGAAISFMRTNDTTDVLFAVPPTPGPPAMPSPPESAYSPALDSTSPGVFAHQQESSPVIISPLGPMPMHPSEPQSGAPGTGKYLTPDDMLKAYAEGKREASSATPTSGGGMRQLYNSNPSTPNSATPMMRQAGNVPTRNSWDADAYGGSA